jgi:uncharacterized protein (TIGR03435 family)
MRRPLTPVLSVLVLSGLAFGQTAAPTTFESAAVHVSAPVPKPSMRGGAIRGGRFEVRTVTMVELIAMAYDMESSKILGGPSWLDWDRFDVLAKAPQGATRKDLSPMLQNLLEDRFKLVVRKDAKPSPAFALSAGKGAPKMKQASGSGEPGCQGVLQNPAPGEIPYQVISCHNITMDAFVNFLRSAAGGYLPDPVVDKTGLTSAWDFELKWTARNRVARDGADAITVFDAVDKQLGLKLEPQQVPLPVLYVESVKPKPTPNLPGVESQIPPPPPTEFEVATIKPSAPDARGQNGRIQNGRVDVQNFTVKQLIQFAWDVNDNDEMIAGLPKSAETNHYDIAAKAVTVGPANTEEIDFDTLQIMLRGLLSERFGLKIHMEDRPVTAYTLTATKQGKLKKADPENRTGCKNGGSTNPVLNRLITCQNTTMAQFVTVLEDMANGYIHAPVKDATGLEGNYDFSVNFSGVNVLPGRQFDPNRSADGAADPNGSLALPEALQKQLGLKLELGKRPLPVLVVDHVADKPTDN